MLGIDANQNLTDYAGALVTAGYTFACRYLGNSTKKDPLTKPEAQHLSDMGLSLLSLWESHSPTVDAYFTAQQGIADGRAALIGATEAGEPQWTGRPVFFTVDEDAEPNVVVDYFHGIRATLFLGPYLVGAYASDAVLELLLQLGLIHYGWKAQPRDWQGGMGFTGANVTQGPERNLAIGGAVLDMDSDQAGDNTDFGQWQLGPSVLR